MKKYAKMLTAILLIVTIPTIIVSANPISSPTLTYTVNGVTYTVFNGLHLTTGTAVAHTHIDTNIRQPAGYFGSQARIFENGAVRYQSPWRFNGANDWSASASINGATIRGMTYASRGLVRMWNGSSLSEYQPTGTNNIIGFSIGGQINSEYEININGQTHGSALDAVSNDDLPELILAKDVDGNIGYVYADDLIGDIPNTPKEAVEYMNRLQELNDIGIYSITIPLYDVDGETIIGEFEICVDVS